MAENCHFLGISQKRSPIELHMQPYYLNDRSNKRNKEENQEVKEKVLQDSTWNCYWYVIRMTYRAIPKCTAIDLTDEK